MKTKLSTQLSLGFAAIVLVTVALISLASNLLINQQFEKYIEQEQKSFADNLADNLSTQYDAQAESWNLDYIHGFGMYALNDGYILKIYDKQNDIVWDAENHDMSLCHQIMNDISLRMKEQNLKAEGNFVTYCYDLKQNGNLIGYVDISYYSPYSFNENDFHFIDALNHILLVVGLLSLIGAIIAGIFLAKHIASPIVKIMEVTREISEGNYKIRFDSEINTKELSELIYSVKQMAQSLEKQEVLRRRLTTDVAHELRTPIANVSSYLEAIIEGIWEPTPKRLQSCYDELSRISDIVSDLEQLRQIESENLVLKKEAVDLWELVNTVCAAFETEFAVKHLTYHFIGDSSVIFGDRKRLHQVVYNLVSNAVKYSLDGGQITITIQDSAQNGTLTIKDTGIGISKEELPLIFERFYRTDYSRSRKTGGSGIGLTIAKAIVQAHNGTITVQSEKGQGSEFSIQLPK